MAELQAQSEQYNLKRYSNADALAALVSSGYRPYAYLPPNVSWSLGGVVVVWIKTQYKRVLNEYPPERFVWELSGKRGGWVTDASGLVPDNDATLRAATKALGSVPVPMPMDKELANLVRKSLILVDHGAGEFFLRSLAGYNFAYELPWG